MINKIKKLFGVHPDNYILELELPKESPKVWKVKVPHFTEFSLNAMDQLTDMDDRPLCYIRTVDGRHEFIQAIKGRVE
jgi:hypothetical protein